MVYTFRVVSDEVDNFRREIKIDSEANFLELKNAICESVGYDKNQICSFFICEDNWEKEKEITMEDMGSDSSQDVYLMEDSILGDFIEDEGQRLMFTFDYMTDRSFFIEMKEIETGQNMSEPLCTLSMGNPPAQTIDFNEFESKVNAKAAASSLDDLDEDFYGDNQFNDDEFDLEGFDEMNFDEKF